MRQEAPKTIQEHPKSSPRAPKMAPRALKSVLRAPREPQERDKSPPGKSSAGHWLVFTHSVLATGGGKIDGFTV